MADENNPDNENKNDAIDVIINKNDAIEGILKASMGRVEGYGDIQAQTPINNVIGFPGILRMPNPTQSLLNPPTAPEMKEASEQISYHDILNNIHDTLLDLKLGILNMIKTTTRLHEESKPSRIEQTKRSSEGIASAAVGESLGLGAAAGGLLKGGSIGLLGFMAILPVLSAAWLKMRGGEISEKFKDLTDKMRAFFLGLGSFGLAPLLTKVPVVGKVFSQIGSFFQSIGAAFNMPLMKRFTDGAAKTGSIITKFASTIGILLKPFSIIIRPALALARAIPGFGQALTAIIAIFDGLVASVKVLQEGGSIFDAIKAFFVGAIDGFFNPIVDLIDLLTFGLIPDGFIDAIKDPFARIMPWFEAAAKPIFDVLENLGDFFKSIFEGDLLGAVSALGSAVSSAVSALVSAVSRYILILPNLVLRALERIFPDFIGGIRETIMQIQDWVMGKVNALNPFAKSVEEQNIEMVRTQREGRIQAEADELFGPTENLNRRERQERNRFIREREREMNREIRSARRELGDEGASDLLVRQERHEVMRAGLQQQNVTVVNNNVDNSSVMNQQSNISGGGGSRASAQNPVMAY